MTWKIQVCKRASVEGLRPGVGSDGVRQTAESGNIMLNYMNVVNVLERFTHSKRPEAARV